MNMFLRVNNWLAVVFKRLETSCLQMRLKMRWPGKKKKPHHLRQTPSLQSANVIRHDQLYNIPHCLTVSFVDASKKKKKKKSSGVIENAAEGPLLPECVIWVRMKEFNVLGEVNPIILFTWRISITFRVTGFLFIYLFHALIQSEVLCSLRQKQILMLSENPRIPSSSNPVCTGRNENTQVQGFVRVRACVFK